MSGFCTACGNALEPAQRLCVRCGAAVPVDRPTPVAIYQSTVVLTAPPEAEPAKPSMLRTMDGDWLAGLGAVTAGFATMALLAAVSWLLIGDGTVNGVSLPVQYIPMLVALAVGGTVTAADTDLHTSLQAAFTARPLGLTLAGYAVLALVLLRRLRATASRADAGNAAPPVLARRLGLLAVPVAFLHTAVLTLLCVLTEASIPSGTGQLAVRVDPGPTLAFGTLTLAVALVVAFALARPGLTGGWTEYVRGILAAPVGVLRSATIIVVSVLAVVLVSGLVGVAVAGSQLPTLDAVPLGRGDAPTADDLWRAGIAAGILFLPNAAYALLLVGLGAPVSGGAGFGVPGLGAAETLSIRDLTDAHGLFWLWPAAVAVLLLRAGAVAARRTGPGVRGHLARYSLTVTLPVVLLLLPYGLSGRIEADARAFAAAGWIGFDYGLTLLLGAVFGVVAAALAPRPPASLT